MSKKVLVSFQGCQTLEGEKEITKEAAPGDYYKKENKHYIFYEGNLEGFLGTVRTSVKAEKHRVVLHKKGTVSTAMIFSAGQKTIACYSTPLGDIALSIQTRNINIEETKEELTITLEYTLEMNHASRGDCKIIIKATIKE